MDWRHSRLVLLLLAATGCDRRPVSAYAALPAPGTAVPAFRLPGLRGGELTSDSLAGRPTVLVLWSTTCGYSRRVLQAVEQLRADYEPRGVRVLLLADDRDADRLRFVIDSAGVQLEVARAGKTLRRLFDQSATAPERNREKVRFGLPSFLVLDRDARVAVRTAGVVAGQDSLERLRQPLDSLLRQES
jgi:thiol-disulfide isomerase/thioredoxin